MTKGQMLDGKQVAKHWLALFQVNAKEDSIARVLIIKGAQSNYWFEDEDSLNKFLAEFIDEIRKAAVDPQSVKTINNPLIPNLYNSPFYFGPGKH
jgi:hypothetical protein